jgi:hypothetical protein
MLRYVSARLPRPGPSFASERALRVRERTYQAGMSQPTSTDDGWWLAVLWVTDDDGVISFRDVAPLAGPPAGPPLLRLGPAFAGSLSGMIVEENGRLAMRLNVVSPPDDEGRPWLCPLAIRAAFRWDPVRIAAMSANELAEQVLDGFRRSVEGLARP